MRTNTTDGSPRCWGWYISLMVAAPMARLGAKKRPARKRRMLSPAKLCKRGAEGEEAAADQCADVYRQPTDCFRQRPADDGAEPEGEDVERQREDGLGCCHAELSFELGRG